MVAKSRIGKYRGYGLEISRAAIPRQIRFSLLVLHCSAVTPVGAFNDHRSCNGIYQSIWFSPVAVFGFRLRSRELRVTMYCTTPLYVATIIPYSPAPWGTLGSWNRVLRMKVLYNEILTKIIGAALSTYCNITGLCVVSEGYSGYAVQTGSVE